VSDTPARIDTPVQPPHQPPPVAAEIPRAALGGVLMGMANLVPGISGGTMLLAAGIYPRFIDALAEITTLRFRSRSVILLATVVGSAALAILFLAGPVKDLVVHQRWMMYSLFIGLTLGGIPEVWRLFEQRGVPMWVGAFAGFAAMAALALLQQLGATASVDAEPGFLLLGIAGLAGAGAMILPGISGGYLLLVLGVYVPILAGIEQFVSALKTGAFDAAMDVAWSIGLPVGLGIILGVLGASNLLKICLERFRAATLGVLLGLLVGAVIGLWPFQGGVKPLPGDVLKGRVMTEQSILDLNPKDYPTQYFRPDVGHAAGAVGLVLIGIGITFGVSRLGRLRFGRQHD